VSIQIKINGISIGSKEIPKPGRCLVSRIAEALISSILASKESLNSIGRFLLTQTEKK
jgi:hypothetical protein